MGVKYLSDQGPDGAILGYAAADKLGFYGSTPVVQQTVGTTLSTSGLLCVSTTSGGSVFGFSSAAAYYSSITAIAALQAALKNLGFSA